MYNIYTGNKDSILFKDAKAQEHFNKIRMQNDSLLGELVKQLVKLVKRLVKQLVKQLELVKQLVKLVKRLLYWLLY